MRGAVVRLAGLVAVDAAALVTLRPDAGVVTALRAPHAWIARAGVDGAAAEFVGALLWLAACWVAVGLLAAALAAVPGGCGRAGARLAAVLLPRAMYRVVAGAAGLGIALTPVAAGAATVPPTPARASTASPGWPTSTAPAPGWPVLPEPRRRGPGEASGSAAGARPASTDHVVVAPGDSLWSIAAAHLDRAAPARVAAAWPRWYAANRTVIGPDPDHIVAGQVLDVPAHRCEEGTS